MRLSPTISILLLGLLVIGLGCRDREVLQPVQPAPRPACLIVKATYKTIYISGPKTAHEQLTLNGKKYDVYTSEVTQYTYDDKGRLTRELLSTHRSSSDKLYTYTATKMITRLINTNDGVVTQTILDTIPINEQGYEADYIYDEFGHLLMGKQQAKTTIVRLKTNNIVYLSVTNDGGRIVFDSEFDFNRLALPQIYQFRGSGDQNLQTAYITSSQNIPYYKDGVVFRDDYRYEFDSNGRVMRRIAIGTSFPDSGWPFAHDPGNIGVTDFEYECR